MLGLDRDQYEFNHYIFIIILGLLGFCVNPHIWMKLIFLLLAVVYGFGLGVVKGGIMSWRDYMLSWRDWGWKLLFLAGVTLMTWVYVGGV